MTESARCQAALSLCGAMRIPRLAPRHHAHPHLGVTTPAGPEQDCLELSKSVRDLMRHRQ